MRIQVLSNDDCLGILARNRIARLGTSHDGQPYVVPIHYVYHESQIYAFSMPGRKIDYMRSNTAVALLVEELADAENWTTIVVEGRYEELPDAVGFKRQRERAWELLARNASWWEPGAIKPAKPQTVGQSGHVFFRIDVDTLSGRRGQP